MANEPEWKDANYSSQDLPNKGRAAIQFIIGGIVLCLITIIGMRVRPILLAFGAFAFFSGISMLLRRRKVNFKTNIIVIIAGFLMLLAHPRFGVIAAFAGYFLIVGALLLVVFGLIKAVKISWDVGNN